MQPDYDKQQTFNVHYNKPLFPPYYSSAIIRYPGYETPNYPPSRLVETTLKEFPFILFSQALTRTASTPDYLVVKSR